MNNMLNVGVLALQGGVEEHVDAVRKAAKKTKILVSVRIIRTANELEGLDALLLPGGESTTLSMLLKQQGMMESIRRIRGIFGTCAGLILMAKNVEGAEEGQEFLQVMDVNVARNAYGGQLESFEAKIEIAEGIGKINAVFIRAPKIISTGAGVDVLANQGGHAVLVVQKTGGQILLGATFHPELATTKVHEYFLRQLINQQ